MDGNIELKLTLRQQQAVRTKEILFNSALTLFKERGFDNVTVDEITALAGTAKGTFYTYFSNKRDVIVEEFLKIDFFYTKITSVLDKHQSASDKLRFFTKEQLRYVKNEIGLEVLKILYKSQINNNLDPSERILIDQNRYLSTIVSSVIEYGQKNNEFRTGIKAKSLALWFNRSMRGLFLDWSISNGDFELIQQGMKYFTNYLMPGLCIK